MTLCGWHDVIIHVLTDNTRSLCAQFNAQPTTHTDRPHTDRTQTDRSMRTDRTHTWLFKKKITSPFQNASWRSLCFRGVENGEHVLEKKLGISLAGCLSHLGNSSVYFFFLSGNTASAGPRIDWHLTGPHSESPGLKTPPREFLGVWNKQPQKNR